VTTSQRWRDAVGQEIRDRLQAATTPADQAVLVRELIRLSDACLKGPDEDIPWDDLDHDRFGLTQDPGADYRLSELSSDLPEDVRRRLRNVLPVDLAVRRHNRPAVADAMLRRLTPFTTYRNVTQKSAVRALLTMPEGAVLSVTMSTGTGKSLLFQLGALHWRMATRGEEQPVVIVLVPTVSLALDHELSAWEFEGPDGKKSLKACRALTSDTSVEDRRQVEEEFRQGKIPILFLTPEMALHRFRDTLEEAAKPLDDKPVACKARLEGIFIDEAHVVASWGKSFRPDLQRFPALVTELRRGNPSVRTVLLSATVDTDTQEVLKTQYVKQSVKMLEITEGVPRREFSFVEHRSATDEARDQLVEQLVDVLPRPGLIYTTEVQDAVDLEARLRRRGYERLAVFTGKTDARERKTIVQRWRNNDLDLVVATSAFGMGIDQNRVRFVLHACMPENALRYYQEIGRAGRDGYQAFALCLYTTEDLNLAHRLAIGKTLKGEAPPRWKDLIETKKFEPNARDITQWRLDLNAGGAEGVTGEQHVKWNKSLLVQLQRYGALEIVASPDDRDEWVVRPTGHGDLWDPAKATDAIKGLFRERDEEEKKAKKAVDEFCESWGNKTECRLVQLVHLVERESREVAPCGRCASCESQAHRPHDQEICPGGADTVWPAVRTPEQEDCRVCTMADTPASLIDQWLPIVLARGVEQIVVPDELAERVSKAWAEHSASDAGWVVAWSDALSGREALRWRVLGKSTALVLTERDGVQVNRAWQWADAMRKQWFGTGPEKPFVTFPAMWVSREGTEVPAGKLVDVATRYPQYEIL